MKFRDIFKVKFSVNFPDSGPDDCHCTLGHQAISCHAAALVSSRIDKKEKKKKVITLVAKHHCECVIAFKRKDTVKAF